MAKKRRSVDVEDRIRSVDEISKYAKILVYGRNKNGKTRFAATWPRVLICDIQEEGTRSARGSGADVIEVNSFDEVGDVYWYLKAGNHKYRTIAIDTLTALQDAAQRKVLGEAEERDPTREHAMPDRRTYGRANQLVKQMVLEFRNLPMHVVFLAQERVEVDEETDEPALRTAQLSPGSRGTALGAVGLIGRIYLHEGKKGRWEARMLVGPHEEYDTGNRIELPRIIRNPTGKQIIKAWLANPPAEEGE